MSRAAILVVLGASIGLSAQSDRFATAPGHRGSILAVAAAPRGRAQAGSESTLLATAGSDGIVRLWRAAGSRDSYELRAVRTLTGHEGPVNAVSFAPDGLSLASGGSDGTVRLWDIATGRQRSLWRAHTGEVSALAFTPDARTLVTAGADRTMCLWQIATGQKIRTFSGNRGAVLAVDVSEDGKLLASADAEGAVMLRDLPGGKLLGTLVGHQGRATGVAFQERGRLLASSGADGTVRLWMSATGEGVLTLHTPTGVSGVSFSLNHVASSGADGSVRLWAPYNGLELRTLDRPGGAGSAVAFFNNGRGVAFGNQEGTLALWQVGLRRTFRRPDGATGTRESALRAEPTIFVLDLPSTRLLRIGRGRLPAWSPDSRVVAFDSESADGNDAGYGVWDGRSVQRFGRSSAGPIRMAVGRNLLVAELLGQFRDDGEMIAGSDETPARIVVHDLRSGDTKILALAPKPQGREQWATYVGPLAISPGDDLIAMTFEAGRGAMLIHPTVLRSEVVALKPDGTVVRRLGKGRVVRFLSSGELVVADDSSWPVALEALSVATGARRALFRVPSRFFDLSEDGRRIVYQEVGETVYVWDAGAAPRRLSDGAFPALSRDGALVAFGRRGRGYEKGEIPLEPALYVMRIADGTMQRVDLAGPRVGMSSPAGTPGWWAWAPDGQRLAVTLEEAPDTP